MHRYEHLSIRHLHSFPTRRSSDLSRHLQRRNRRQMLRGFSVYHHSAAKCDNVCRNKRDPQRGGRRYSPAEGRACSRSEEHTSELQSRENLVCRLLLEKKKKLVYKC